MTYEEWQRVAKVIPGWWPSGDWGEDNVQAYYVLLKDHYAEVVASALKVMAATGGDKWKPSAAEIIGKINEMADMEEAVPTWGTALKWIKAVAARGDADRARKRLEDQDLGIVWKFMEHVGYQDICTLDLDDPQWGGAATRRLQKEWEEYVKGEKREFFNERALGSGDMRKMTFLDRYRPVYELEAGGVS